MAEQTAQERRNANYVLAILFLVLMFNFIVAKLLAF